MTPDKFTAWREAIGGRKFLLTIGAGIVDTALLIKGYLSEDNYVQLTLWTVAAFIGGAATIEIMKNKGKKPDAP